MYERVSLNGLIYKITNNVTGLVYVGQTISKLTTRWSSHKRNAKNSINNFYITKSLQKYGAQAFTIETLVEVPREWLNLVETVFIEICRSTDPLYGYNIKKSGCSYSEWKSDKVSKAMTGRVPWNKGITGQIPWNKDIPWPEEVKVKMRGPREPFSEERKAKLRKVYTPEQIAAKENRKLAKREVARISKSEKMSGDKNPFFGKTHSEESLRKMSEANIGRESWNKGQSPSEETRAKISATLMGNVPWNLGVLATEEHKRKLSESHIGLVQSPETIAKRSAALTGQKRTDEQRKNISEACIGRKNSEGHKQNSSIAGKAKWADPVYRENMLKSRRDKAALRKTA